MAKILIADGSEDFRLALAEALEGRCQVLCCATGTQAMHLIRRESPDLLVLELMLPELDGLTLLERLREEGIQLSVLMISSMLNDYVFQAAAALGITYAIRKPCQIPVAAHRALALLEPGKPEALRPSGRHCVSSLLLELGVATKHKGFPYLREGILVLSEDPAQSITKELYPAVAKRCGCKRENVEHPMRNALEAAWDRGDPGVWQQYFPGHIKRPSNADFLTRMAQELQRRE